MRLLGGLGICAAVIATSIASPAYATTPTPHPSSSTVTHHVTGPATKPAAKPAALDPAAKALAAQVANLQALVKDIKAARQQLVPLQATAEAATLRWRSAQRALREAEQRQRAAVAAATAAQARRDAQQALINAAAVGAYIDGANALSWISAMTATDPADLLTRNATLDVIATQQGAQLDLLGALRGQAEQATAAATKATAQVVATNAAATNARATAIAAMTKQQTVVHDLITRQAQVRAGMRKVLTSVHGKQLNALLRQLADALSTLDLTVNGVSAAMAAVGRLLPVATAKQGLKALALAKTQLGQPYSWGGGDENGPTVGTINPEGNKAGLTTRGWDCSGLALYAWAKQGFALDHYTGFQWFEGRPVDRDQLRPGDLVFFATDPMDPATIHHVGIYAGNGLMIDAPHTGAKVRYDPVFTTQYAGAIRP